MASARPQSLSIEESNPTYVCFIVEAYHAQLTIVVRASRNSTYGFIVCVEMIEPGALTFISKYGTVFPRTIFVLRICLILLAKNYQGIDDD